MIQQSLPFKFGKSSYKFHSCDKCIVYIIDQKQSKHPLFKNNMILKPSKDTEREKPLQVNTPGKHRMQKSSTHVIGRLGKVLP